MLWECFSDCSPSGEYQRRDLQGWFKSVSRLPYISGKQIIFQAHRCYINQCLSNTWFYTFNSVFFISSSTDGAAVIQGLVFSLPFNSWVKYCESASSCGNLVTQGCPKTRDTYSQSLAAPSKPPRCGKWCLGATHLQSCAGLLLSALAMLALPSLGQEAVFLLAGDVLRSSAFLGLDLPWE